MMNEEYQEEMSIAIRLVVRRVEGGATYAEALEGLAFRFSPAQIRGACIFAGVESVGQGRHNRKTQQVNSALASIALGMGVVQAANEHGVSHATLYARLRGA